MNDFTQVAIDRIAALEKECAEHHRTCEILGTKLARAEEENRQLREALSQIANAANALAKGILEDK